MTKKCFFFFLFKFYSVLIAGLKYAASEPKTMGRTFLRLVSKY